MLHYADGDPYWCFVRTQINKMEMIIDQMRVFSQEIIDHYGIKELPPLDDDNTLWNTYVNLPLAKNENLRARQVCSPFHAVPGIWPDVFKIVEKENRMNKPTDAESFLTK